MKIAVLGSNSFSGQDLISLLLDDPNYEVIGISRSPEKSRMFLSYKNRSDMQRFRFYRLDMNKDMDGICALLDAEKPDYVINFAAQSDVGESWRNPADWFQTNTVALANLISHLHGKDYLKKYVHISSPEIYGTCDGIDETAPFNPSTPYAASKAAADLLLSVYAKQGFPLITIRSTNVYGACQQIHKIIPKAIICLKRGEKVELRGGGEAVKSYIHIRDVSRAEKLILEQGKIGETYHIAPYESYSIRQLVKLLCNKLNKSFAELTEETPRHKGRDAVYRINADKLRALGWKPEIDIDTGLDEVIAWVDKHICDEIINMPLEYRHAC